ARSDRPATGRQTNETTNYSRADPSAGARSGSSRTPATAVHLTAARVGSRGGLHANRASQSYGSAPSKPRAQAPAPCAADGSWEYVAPAGYTRTSRLDRKPVRA